MTTKVDEIWGFYEGNIFVEKSSHFKEIAKVFD